MQITHQMTIDMALQLPSAPIAAVQGDGNTRILAVTLLENGAPWQIPEAAVADVAFRKSDGTKGIYSRLPDGSAATSREGNVLHATLAPQMLTCPGAVLATVVFRTDGEKTLAAFPFTVHVASNPAAGAEVSEDYFNPTDISDLRAELAAGLATKAPAGYGLGGKGVMVYDIDNLFDTGVYTMDPLATGNPMRGYGGLVEVSASEYFIKQTVTLPTYHNATMERTMRLTAGETSYGEWEWPNPLLELGVEYRTTEHYNGTTMPGINRPVYTMAINVGAVGNGMFCTGHGIALSQVISCTAYVSGENTLPSMYHEGSADIDVNAFADPSNLFVYSKGRTSTAGEVHFILRYTKD